MILVPWPWHASQRPPLTLKENRPGPKPRILASRVMAKTRRMWSKTLVYVAGFERGVRPMGDWSISAILSISFAPTTRVCRPGRGRLR